MPRDYDHSLAGAVHDGPIIARSGEYAVRDCGSCGWAHLDPIPAEGELALMYERTYYQENNPGWLDKDRSEQAYWDLEHADKIDDWERLLGIDGDGRLLDVGCAGGLLLEYAVGRGWRAEGIEPAEEPVREALDHGMTVHHGLYQDVDPDPGTFDVVHSKLVGEHLPDPRHHLAWARSALRDGGIVSIHVPNEFNALQIAGRDALGKHDWWIAPPFHINYFSFHSLERLMRSEGFEPVARDTTFPVEWFLLMGEDYIGDDVLGSSVHRRRMALETHLEGLGMRRPLHDHLAQQGVGREAIVHARKR
jgi:SAM-dependent methyltransferase